MTLIQMRRREFVLASLAMAVPRRILGATTAPLPHYFPKGIRPVSQVAKPHEQWAEYLRMIAAAEKAFEVNWHEAIPLIPNGERKEVSIAGRKTTIVFDHWVRQDKDTVRFTSYLGNEMLTNEQFKVVEDYTIAEITRAVDLNYAFYKDLRKLAIESLAGEAGLGMSIDQLEQVVTQKVPENPRFTFEELYWLPKKMEKADFVAREIHLGYDAYGMGAIGFAWLDSGLAYLTPMGQILDYLLGVPLVTQHELIHTNKVLQSLPFAEAFDVELAASIPEMLTQGDYVHLQFHHYVEDLREMAWVFFGYDYKRVRKEVILFDADTNLMIDEKKFAEATKLLNEVKAQYMKFFPEAIGEFYGKMVLWAALQDKLVDKRAVWRIMMRAKYEPTILGGKEKTAKFLKANEENIKQDSQEAWNESGSSDSKNHEMHERLYGLARLVGLDLDDKAQVERFMREFKLKPADLQSMNQEQIMRLVRQVFEKRFSQKERGGVR